MTPSKSLSNCPDCGQTFVSVKRNHSCGHYNLEDHLAGKEPVVRASYERLLETMKRFGPVGVFPVKTRIIFQAEVKFAAAIPRKRWLRRQAAHPRIRKVAMGVFRDYGHGFRLIRPDDVDEEPDDRRHQGYLTGYGLLA